MALHLFLGCKCIDAAGQWPLAGHCTLQPAGIATLGSARKAIKASVAAHSSHAETDNNPKDKGAAD